MGIQIKHLLFLGLFSVFTLFNSAGIDNENVYLNKTSPQYKQLLSVLDKDYYKSTGYLYTEGESKARNYLSYAQENYKKNKYKDAVDNYILVCQTGTFKTVYYLFGLCLTDMGDFEAAKLAYKKSISYNFSRTVTEEEVCKDLITLDTNGIMREYYFAYYNLACIESLQNNINASYEYLCKALYYGYPYIDHIRKDADLRNLFDYNNGTYLNAIEEVYKAGSDNPVAGKGYEWKGGNASWDYHFTDDRHMYIHAWSVWPDPGGWISADYYVKNYIIVITNLKYFFDEEERWKAKSFTLYLNQFVSLDGKETYYEEVPPKSY